MSQIFDIIEGHLNELFNKQEDLSTKRLQICSKCPIVKHTSLGAMCDASKWINPKTKETSNTEVKGWVRGCGCRLSAKTRLPDNHCIINLW